MVGLGGTQGSSTQSPATELQRHPTQPALSPEVLQLHRIPDPQATQPTWHSFSQASSSISTPASQVDDQGHPHHTRCVAQVAFASEADAASEALRAELDDTHAKLAAAAQVRLSHSSTGLARIVCPAVTKRYVCSIIHYTVVFNMKFDDLGWPHTVLANHHSAQLKSSYILGPMSRAQLADVAWASLCHPAWGFD